LDIELTVRAGQVPEAAKQYAREKLSKAARIFDRIGSLHVSLEEGKERCKVHLVAHLDSGATIVAEEECKELRSAIEKCSDKFDRQVRREKERLIGRNRRTEPEAGEGGPQPGEPSYEDVLRDDLEGR